MKSLSVKGLGVLSAIVACASISACGSKPSTSALNWEQSRSDTQRYAYLWASDLEDEFLFGGSVIDVDDFLSGALNFTLPPLSVHLKLNEAQDKLRVLTAENAQVMEFDVKKDGERFEVDFGSAGNDLQLQGIMNVMGGRSTVADNDGYWISQTAPEVSYIDQDNNTVVVNLKHTVDQVLLGRDEITGELFVREVLSEHPGVVTFRLWMQRKNVLPRIGAGLKTIADAAENNVGYFASSMAATIDGDEEAPIQRFALGDVADPQDSITFYLKDFPAAYQQIGKEAVLSWNEAFDDQGKVKVAIAPDTMDVGDPRYHVIKWFDGTDRSLPWAGVAKMIVNPDTGIVMSGGVYVQGSTLIDIYEGVTAFSSAASEFPFESTGRIGDVDLSLDEGEQPVVPYFTDLSQDFDTYMQGYYKEVVAHEVGHVFGLRHNFKGSTQLDSEGATASVMDYAPRSERNQYTGLGTYDFAAIRWAYFGETPDSSLPFCTDEHIATEWDCNQGDFGDPIAFHIRGVVDGVDLVRQAPVAIEDVNWTKPITGVVENAIKIFRLKNQLNAEQRSEVEEKIPAVFTYALDAQPHPELSADDQAVVEKNLLLLKSQIADAFEF